MRDVVVVGGGVAGLVAARDLARAGRDVLLLEGSPRIGGKLKTGEVAGLHVDVGAEAMLARRPEGMALAAELGIEVVHPTSASSRIWSYGALRPMPRSLMGVPFDLDQLAASGLLSEAGLARASREDLSVDFGDADVSVGDLVAARLGAELVERLVEPLLGGVYAGHAHALSTRAAVPQLLTMAARGGLLEQAAAIPTSTVPVFGSLVGGMGRLPGLIAEDHPFDLEVDATVRELRSVGSGWELTVGPTTAPRVVKARSVVLATPAAPTARLLGEVSPEAAAELAGIETASVAVVTFVFDSRAIPDDLRDASGFLVPPVEQRAIKASTFSFAKWQWVGDLDPDRVVLRTSIGRHREEVSLQVDDDALVRVSLAELAALARIDAHPIDTHVQRWGGGLPQYAVGHVERVGRARAALPAGVEVCGASLDGVGIPAVIGSARAAAARLVAAGDAPA